MVVEMKKMVVIPMEQIDGIEFGCERELARKGFGKKYKEIKKSVLSKNTMDAYDDYHVYYSPQNTFEAIEVFGKVKILVEGEKAFPVTIEEAKEFLGDFDTKGDQLISKDMGIAYTVSPEDDNKIEAIMVGGKGYF